MSPSKILVVDDDEAIRQLVCERLRRDGFEALEAADGAAGLSLALKSRPDLLVVDLLMPKLNGFELVRRLRTSSSAPVVFLSGRADEADRVAGLTLGADDYVTKPFSLPELMARIEAVLRRTNNQRDTHSPALRLGELEIDRFRREARVKGKYRPLAPREFDLLLLLAEEQGRVVTRDAIVARFWGKTTPSEAAMRTIDQHVARLRRKLASERGRILTVKNSGYRLLLD